MRQMLPAALIGAALSLLQAECAAAEGTKPDVWASSMLARLPFEDGRFDREQFRRRSESLLIQIESYYRDMGESALKRAEERGSKRLASMLRSRTERLVREAARYVRETEAGMVRTVSPEGTTPASVSEARRRLLELAASADTDRSGTLDRFEAALAEAAFAKGLNLSEPGVVDRLSRELAWSYAGAE